MARVPQIRIKRSTAARNAAVNFAAELDPGELLTGTPTVTSTPAGLTTGSVKTNTAQLTVDGDTAEIGQAVQFAVSGGTSGVTYEIVVTCSTAANPAQTLVAECVLIVIDP